MTYGEFKQQLGYLLAGDTDMRNDNDAILSLYAKAVDNILTDCEPLELVTADRERYGKSVYRSLDDVFFIRKPVMPANDTAPLDMDDRLNDVCLYLVAADMTRMPNDMQRRQYYLAEAARMKDQYRFETFTYLQDIGYFRDYYRKQTYTPTKNRKDLTPVLDEWGLLKFYQVYKDILDPDWQYRWDTGAVDTLDKFMLDWDGSKLSPSQLALWEQFCAWEDADISTDPETKALKVLDGIYLTRSGF